MNSSRNTTHSQTHTRTLYKKISQSLNTQQQSELRMSSAHQTRLSSTQSPALGFPNKHHLTLEHEPTKKVAFKSIGLDKRDSLSCKKIKLIIDKKPTLHKKPQSQIVSIKTFKSLDSSFTHILNDQQASKSKRTNRTVNPQFQQCNKISQEILRKLEIFEDSRFYQKQITGWLETYFQQERSVLARIFLKPSKKKTTHKAASPPELERNLDVVISKVQNKQKDNFLSIRRFVTVAELSLLSEFLENLYLEKSKIKMKEIEESVTGKMTLLCQQIRKQYNTDYLYALRQKPAEIANFTHDLAHSETQLGHLKRISTLNRNRFKMLNDTDHTIDTHIRLLNSQVKKNNQQIVPEIIA